MIGHFAAYHIATSCGINKWEILYVIFRIKQFMRTLLPDGQMCLLLWM